MWYVFVAMAKEIIGITGTSASGKDTASEHIEQAHGYLHISTADMVREVAMEKHGTTDQMVLRHVGSELRGRLGKSALCRIAIERYHDMRNDFEGLVISGYRSVEGAQLIHDNGGILLFLDAPIGTRYARLQERHRIGESTTFKQFKTFEEEEYSGQLATGQDLAGIRKISDIYLSNAYPDVSSFKASVDNHLDF
jgi:dephospho-CoA kinase